MKLLWLDLETTGLDPRKDDVLEIAFALADIDRPYDVESTIPSRLLAYRWASASWPQVVREMHAKSGLLEDLERPGADLRYMAEVEDELLGHVPEVEDREEKTVLAGSSVHFDLEFLRNTMPTLAKRLSHRVYDVSAIKLFCRSMGMQKIPKAEAHRAAADVLESIEHAKLCAEWLENNL